MILVLIGHLQGDFYAIVALLGGHQRIVGGVAASRQVLREPRLQHLALGEETACKHPLVVLVIACRLMVCHRDVLLVSGLVDDTRLKGLILGRVDREGLQQRNLYNL